MTWDDVRTRALHCPVLHQAVTLVETGRATREEALIAVALTLSADRERFIQRLTLLLMTDHPRPLCAACGHRMNGISGMCAISWCRCMCVAERDTMPDPRPIIKP